MLKGWSRARRRKRHGRLRWEGVGECWGRGGGLSGGRGSRMGGGIGGGMGGGIGGYEELKNCQFDCHFQICVDGGKFGYWRGLMRKALTLSELYRSLVWRLMTRT